MKNLLIHGCLLTLSTFLICVLGINRDDENLLKSTVHFIYHMGASVRFDETFSDAIIVNVRSAREVSQLAMRCEQIEVLTHVSTTYCAVDNQIIEERFYPPPMNWEDAIKLAENNDRFSESLSLKCTEGWPNTYTFSKRLAEAAVVEICSGRVPVVVVRPSIGM